MLDTRCWIIVFLVWSLVGGSLAAPAASAPQPATVTATDDALTAQPSAPVAQERTPITVPADRIAFLQKAPEYDKEWPPEYTRWVFECSGSLSSDTWVFNNAGLPDQLTVRVEPKTWKAYFYGMPRAALDPKATWNGKGISWRLQDSRILLAHAIFRTPITDADLKTAPRACVAVYTVADGKMIASIEAPLIHDVTTVRIMKHFSYNRLNLVWANTGLNRGFTIPDHVPLRLVLGVTAATPGTAVDVSLEIE